MLYLPGWLRDLTIWSFLMASAHGAGFMVLPFVIGGPTDVVAAGSEHADAVATSVVSGWPLSTALGIHTLTYLAVTAILAWIIDARVGRRFYALVQPRLALGLRARRHWRICTVRVGQAIGDCALSDR